MLGCCSIMQAKLWAIHGLHLIWDKGLGGRIYVKSNSTLVVKIMMHQYNTRIGYDTYPIQ
uniref:RNase H type-1 domain-containing protein n=2 Tax=Cajanus cajan TaxID=3821 RepID=A0A151RUW7_CAJCA|nr:hypothetical protein KK1_032062 [Cajanus cajan]